MRQLNPALVSLDGLYLEVLPSDLRSEMNWLGGCKPCKFFNRSPGLLVTPLIE
jgi:hypothetical protein